MENEEDVEVFAANVLTEEKAKKEKDVEGRGAEEKAKKAEGVAPNINLFSKMYNVVHQGVLSYFHIQSGLKNMLYSEKSGKASPIRWHKYRFMAKDTFSDNVPHKFFVNYTTLEAEDSEVTMTKFQKLVNCFPKPLPLKRFCDPDVVIKAGMCKRPNNFPNMSLGMSSLSRLLFSITVFS
ncbi:hypothetical protein LIER_05594 [Lithospermum erythrorhizon]|uniref:Uncharacterized protein n=1 Tax=Lithospermum erythrorhizon TaxID=34254 RepID=A0AAV3P198_LITER